MVWIARDTTDDGVYTMWANNPPVLRGDGYWGIIKGVSVSDTQQPLLMLSAHCKKWPFPDLWLAKGECFKVDLVIEDDDSNVKVVLPQ
jgi:hypothetical protein